MVTHKTWLIFTPHLRAPLHHLNLTIPDLDQMHKHTQKRMHYVHRVYKYREVGNIFQHIEKKMHYNHRVYEYKGVEQMHIYTEKRMHYKHRVHKYRGVDRCISIQRKECNITRE